jgi:hypothetical protein
MSDKTYNGWTNYETWCIGVWIDNDEPMYREVTALAQSVWDESSGLSAYAKFTGNEIFNREEKAVYTLSNALKEKFEEEKPEMGNTVWSDLLDAAVDEVNWRELAEHFLESVDKAEETVEAEDEE